MRMPVCRNINFSQPRKFCVELFLEEATISRFAMVIYLCLKFYHDSNFANVRKSLKPSFLPHEVVR